MHAMMKRMQTWAILAALRAWARLAVRWEIMLAGGRAAWYERELAREDARYNAELDRALSEVN